MPVNKKLDIDVLRRRLAEGKINQKGFDQAVSVMGFEPDGSDIDVDTALAMDSIANPPIVDTDGIDAGLRSDITTLPFLEGPEATRIANEPRFQNVSTGAPTDGQFGMRGSELESGTGIVPPIGAPQLLIPQDQDQVGMMAVPAIGSAILAGGAALDAATRGRSEQPGEPSNVNIPDTINQIEPVVQPSAPSLGLGEKQRTITTSVITPAEQQAIDEAAAAERSVIDEVENTQNDLNALNLQGSTIRQEQANLAQSNKEAVAEREIAITEAAIAENAEIDTKIETLSNKPLETLFETKGTGSQVLAAVAIGLGALGQGLTGASQNTALNIINKSMDDHIANQKFTLEKQLKALSQKKVSADQKRALGLSMVKNSLIKMEAPMVALNNQLIKLEAQTQNVESKGKVAALRAQNEAKLAQSRAERERAVSGTVTSIFEQQAPVKPLGDLFTDDGEKMDADQRKSYVALEPMEDSLNVMETFETSNEFRESFKDTSTNLMQKLQTITEGLTSSISGDKIPSALVINGINQANLSDAEKAYMRSAIRFATKKLRIESGAAINGDEWVSTLSTLIPTGNQGAKALEKIRDERRQEISAFRKNAGKRQSIKFFYEQPGFKERKIEEAGKIEENKPEEEKSQLEENLDIIKNFFGPQGGGKIRP